MECKIPEEIRKLKPSACTEVKLIHNHYYVYYYTAKQLSSGKWGKKSGKCIGKIIPEVGFVPNKNYQSESEKEEISILEYGQYSLVEQMAKDILEALQACFPADIAAQIFAFAVMLYVNNFTHLDQIKPLYEQSWLSYEYRNYPFKMGKIALGTLMDRLGRRTTRVKMYEQAAIDNSTSEIAVDGHAIRSCSDENDLAEAGYKFSALKEDQVNLLMGIDVNTGMPVFSRMYRGSCNDKSTIEDITEILSFTGILFLIDRGFYSERNLEILKSRGNSYIIPIPSKEALFKDSMANVEYTDSFYYRNGKKHTRIEYCSRKIAPGEHVFVFRDIDENEKCRYNYLHSMELGKSGYTKEGYEENKEFFGVYVLRVFGDISPEMAFKKHKQRWTIETFYQYLKNHGDFNNLKIQDYYKEQGFAFIILIVGQIHQKMVSAVKMLNDNTISTYDVLIMARCLKMEKTNNRWNLKNKRTREMDMLKKMGFIPITSAAE